MYPSTLLINLPHIAKSIQFQTTMYNDSQDPSKHDGSLEDVSPYHSFHSSLNQGKNLNTYKITQFVENQYHGFWFALWPEIVKSSPILANHNTLFLAKWNSSRKFWEMQKIPKCKVSQKKKKTFHSYGMYYFKLSIKGRWCVLAFCKSFKLRALLAFWFFFGHPISEFDKPYIHRFGNAWLV